MTEARFSALDQPTQWTLGNTLVEQWRYDGTMQRLQERQTTSGGGTLLDRTYGYDSVSNLTTLTDQVSGPVQHFTYDHRDRLTHGWTTGGSDASTAYDEAMSYDATGNLLTKGDLSFTYQSGHAHAPSSVNGATFTWDANGNLLSDARDGRTITWDGENRPTVIATTTSAPAGTPAPGTPGEVAATRGGTVVAGNPQVVAPSRGGAVVAGTPNPVAPSREGVPLVTTVRESYAYDADGQRVARSALPTAPNAGTPLVTRYFGGGLWEWTGPQGEQTGQTTAYYRFGGGMVAERQGTGTGSTLVYLHGDHLGSVSMVTDSSGTVIVDADGVTIEHYYYGGDHGPPHAHVSGEGPDTRIGQNGNPLDGDPELSRRQRDVIDNNRKTIRDAIGDIARWYRDNNP